MFQPSCLLLSVSFLVVVDVWREFALNSASSHWPVDSVQKPSPAWVTCCNFNKVTKQFWRDRQPNTNYGHCCLESVLIQWRGLLPPLLLVTWTKIGAMQLLKEFVSDQLSKGFRPEWYAQLHVEPSHPQLQHCFMFNSGFIWIFSFGLFAVPLSQTCFLFFSDWNQLLFSFFTAQRCNSTLPSAWILVPWSGWNLL